MPPGEPKPLLFEASRWRFEAFRKKIVYLPIPEQRWPHNRRRLRRTPCPQPFPGFPNLGPFWTTNPVSSTQNRTERRGFLF